MTDSLRVLAVYDPLEYYMFGYTDISARLAIQ